MCGDYHFTIDPTEKDALKEVPNAGSTFYEQTHGQDKKARMDAAIPWAWAGAGAGLDE